MGEIKVEEDNLPENWTSIASELHLSQLDNLEGDGVNIQCVNSSEFVVGKQTNFNAPVTIINCSSPKALDHAEKPEEEKIIIRDKVLSQTATTTMQQMANGTKAKGLAVKKTKPVKVWTIVLSVMAVLLISVAVGLTLVFEKEEVPPVQETLENSTRPIYSKSAWGGQPAKSFILMKLPVPYLVVSHSATISCSTLETCSPLIQNFQSYHQSMDYADIAYNFLVDSSGNIYEGRGWQRRNVNGGFVNGRNIDVCLIGDFSQDTIPTTEQMDGLKFLSENGVEKGYLSPEYSLLSANSTFATLSPGKRVYEIIKHWPHFDPSPSSHIKDFQE